jgi:ubiquitin carboxyl-terminal hydrolase 34
MTETDFAFSLAQVSTTDFTVAFWPMVATLIPHAAKQPQRCEETFALSHQLFKKLAETSIDFLNLDELVRQWGALLLSHTPNEVYCFSPEVSVCANNSAERWAS